MAKIFPDNIPQNPFPVREDGQEYKRTLDTQVAYVLEEFKKLVSDGYKSAVNGPNYILQFKAVAEELSKIQIAAQELLGDADFDYTRSEFLYKIIGALIFPDGKYNEIPNIDGDITYRTFLKRMIELLVSGSKKSTLQDAISYLTDSDIEIIEKSLTAGTPGSAWTFDDQFSFEINISTNSGTTFPSVDPFILKKNIELILRALKPAHTVYDLRFLFIDLFNTPTDEDRGFQLNRFLYDDFRKYCDGIKNITSSSGIVLSNRRMFSDTSVSFDNIYENSVLTIDHGLNKGQYRVLETRVFPTSTVGSYGYTTSPTGLSGTLTIIGDEIEDLSQNFSTIVEGEIITIIDGPNLGDYRVKNFVGEFGGPIHITPLGPTTRLKLSKCILYLEKKLGYIELGVAYSVTVDRLGVKEVKSVVAEDVSSQFYL